MNRPAGIQSSCACAACLQVKTEGGKIIRVEAHPIPEHPRPRRAQGRVALVGDAAGYVTKCSGEGIYFAAKSGRMCAEAIVEASKNGARSLQAVNVVSLVMGGILWEGHCPKVLQALCSEGVCSACVSALRSFP